MFSQFNAINHSRLSNLIRKSSIDSDNCDNNNGIGGHSSGFSSGGSLGGVYTR